MQNALVEQAMKDGAVGLSTGLIYVPGTYAKTDEIVALARIAGLHGGVYATLLDSAAGCAVHSTLPAGTVSGEYLPDRNPIASP